MIGAGGIGSYLADPWARFLAYCGNSTELTIIDGDIIEPHNLERVYNSETVGEMKAEVLTERLLGTYSGTSLTINCIPEMVVPRNFHRFHGSWLQDNVVILACVDNDKTRVFLEEQLATLRNGVLIAGGNDYHLGQAQLYIRKNGKDLGPKLSEISPEILKETPGNWFPGEEDCTQKYVSAPQLSLVNNAVATAMMGLFYSECVNQTPEEGYLNEVMVNLTSGGSAHQFVREATIPFQVSK